MLYSVWIVGLGFFVNPGPEMFKLWERVKNKQTYSKEYTDKKKKKRATKTPKLLSGDFVKVKKPIIAKKGGLS